MAAAGLDLKAVKTILISHLHGDHIYGLMNNETNAQVFPDAEIVVPAAELKWWTRPGVESIDLGPTRKGLAQRIQATVATWKNVRPFEGEPELLLGVHAVQAPGHSPGMVAHLVTSGSKQFLISADVVNADGVRSLALVREFLPRCRQATVVAAPDDPRRSGRRV